MLKIRAIDGQADAMVTGDDNLRADETLRHEMAAYGVQLWGIDTLSKKLHEREMLI